MKLRVHAGLLMVCLSIVGGALAVAIADYWFDESEEDYIYNQVIGTLARPFTAAHELGHLLTDEEHHSDKWNLMYHGTSTINTVTATKRLDTTPDSDRNGDSHVQ